MKLGIICGCLPKQPGIGPGELYHQLLATLIEKGFGFRPEVSSIWYVTFAESTIQTRRLVDGQNPDILLYHVRPDPYLRASKPWFRYRNKEQKRCWRINFSADDHMVVDVEEPVEIVQRRKKTKTAKTLRHLNYAIGYLLGVNSQAIKREKKVVAEALQIAGKKNIPVLIIGPASRPRSKVEDFLLLRLEKKLRASVPAENYVTCFGSIDTQGNPLFFGDGVHVNPAGNKRFSELIFEAIKQHLGSHT
jgi:hypothetical protein